MLQIIIVLEFPPSESLSRCVSLESLYLICLALCLCCGSDISAKSLITAPNVVNDLFIAPASFMRWPSAPVSLHRSEPAKSTIWNLEVLIIYSPFFLFCTFLITAVKTVCDLLLSLFMYVLAMCLASFPLVIKAPTFSTPETYCLVQGSKNTPRSFSSRRVTRVS